jgi:glycine/D-amino acid oxidase-like deaminating enzyme
MTSAWDERGFQSCLWPATAGEPPEAPPLEADTEAEVAIVGAGFTGLSVALHLVEAGVRVVVLERRVPGWGASGRNAGFVVPNFAKVDPDAVVERLGRERGEALNRLVGTAGDLVFELIRRHGIECDAEQAGWVQPAHTEAALPVVRRRFEQWAARGRPVELLDRDATIARTGCRHVAGGWLDRSGGTIHPLRYVHGLQRAATAQGARVHGDSPVLAIEPGRRARWRLRTAEASVEAEVVLLCQNAYAAPLRPDLARSIIPLTVYQMATRPLDQALRKRLLPEGGCVSDTRTDLFTFRLDAEGRLISGGMALATIGARQRMGRAIARRLARLLDLDPVPEIAFAWHGQAAITRDFLPRLHLLGDGLLAGIGCNGRGIAMTTALGGVLAQAARGVEVDALPVPARPVGALRPHRLLRHAPKLALVLGRLRDRR